MVFAPFRSKNGLRLPILARELRECMDVFVISILSEQDAKERILRRRGCGTD